MELAAVVCIATISASILIAIFNKWWDPIAVYVGYPFGVHRRVEDLGVKVKTLSAMQIDLRYEDPFPSSEERIRWLKSVDDLQRKEKKIKMNLLSRLEEPNAAKTSTVDVVLSLEKASTGQLLKVPTDNQDAKNTRELADREETQQLTVFYGGKVVVVDNFPSTKVKDLLQMANAGDGVDKSGSSSAVPRSLPRPAQSYLPDLPIARRNSLHRFLEKRKGRIIAKAPYQVSSSVAPSKQANGDNSWLGLGQEVTIKQEI